MGFEANNRTTPYVALKENKEKIENAYCKERYKEILFTDEKIVTVEEMLDGKTVENKGKIILTEIFPLVQKHDI